VRGGRARYRVVLVGKTKRAVRAAAGFNARGHAEQWLPDEGHIHEVNEGGSEK